MVGMLLFIGVLIGVCIVGMMGIILIVLSIMTRDWKCMKEVLIPTLTAIMVIILTIIGIQAG